MMLNKCSAGAPVVNTNSASSLAEQERGSDAQKGPQEVMRAQLLQEPPKGVVFFLAFPRTQLAGLGLM